MLNSLWDLPRGQLTVVVRCWLTMGSKRSLSAFWELIVGSNSNLTPDCVLSSMSFMFLIEFSYAFSSPILATYSAEYSYYAIGKEAYPEFLMLSRLQWLSGYTPVHPPPKLQRWRDARLALFSLSSCYSDQLISEPPILWCTLPKCSIGTCRLLPAFSEIGSSSFI